MRNNKIKTLITEFISSKIAPIDDLTKHPSWVWFLCVARSADKGQRERWIMHHCLLYTTVNWPRMMDGHVLCLFLPWLCSGDGCSFFPALISPVFSSARMSLFVLPEHKFLGSPYSRPVQWCHLIWIILWIILNNICNNTLQYFMYYSILHFNHYFQEYLKKKIVSLPFYLISQLKMLQKFSKCLFFLIYILLWTLLQYLPSIFEHPNQPNIAALFLYTVQC